MTKPALVVAFLLAFVAYHGALAGAFLPGDEVRSAYRPVTALTFAVDRAIWERNPAGYHLTNVLFHGAVAVLAALVASALGMRREHALAATALFAVHPVLTAAVTPVAGRTELVAACAWLIAFRAFLEWDATAFRPFGVAAAIAGVLAVYAKESAFTLAFVALAYALTREHRRAALGRGLALAGVLALAVLHARSLAPRPLAYAPASVEGAGEVARAYLTAARQLLSPTVLSADYSHAVFAATSPSVGAAWAGVAAYAAVLLALAWRWPFAAFGLAALAFALAPGCALALTQERFTERALYLPAAIAVFGLVALAPPRAWLILLATALVALGAGRTIVRNRDYADPFALLAATVRDHPECARARTNFGVALEERGRTQEAEAEYRAALAILPGDPLTADNLGTLLMERGALAEAEEWLERAVARAPEFASALSHLGAVECERGQLAEAEAHLTRAVQLEPHYAPAFMHLGMTLRRRGRFADAERAYRQAIALDSSRADTYNNLGALYLDMKRGEEAVAAFVRAIELEPAAKLVVNLARAFSSTGKTRAAEEALIRASSMEPDSATVQEECARIAYDLKLERLGKHFSEKAARLK